MLNAKRRLKNVRVPAMINRVFQYLQGRHTAFALAFFVSGNILHWFGKLDATYIGFMGTLMGFVLGHSVQENHFDKDTSDK